VSSANDDGIVFFQNKDLLFSKGFASGIGSHTLLFLSIATE